MNTPQDQNGTNNGHPESPDPAREAGRTQQPDKGAELDSEGVEKTLDQPSEENIHPFERYQ